MSTIDADKHVICVGALYKLLLMFFCLSQVNKLYPRYWTVPASGKATVTEEVEKGQQWCIPVVVFRCCHSFIGI